MKTLKIEFEGTDGAGKTTGLGYFIEQAKKQGLSVLSTVRSVIAWIECICRSVHTGTPRSHPIQWRRRGRRHAGQEVV